ncbi:hypothetical protein R1sor_003501 [Riccia sorocarpa]|uniref:NAD(P)-binding domain-containing protein n=1 Tax=Riccia sorocarpa TaxID=122646 RepID=A0ABD3H5Q2_9MARC
MSLTNAVSLPRLNHSVELLLCLSLGVCQPLRQISRLKKHRSCSVSLEPDPGQVQSLPLPSTVSSVATTTISRKFLCRSISLRPLVNLVLLHLAFVSIVRSAAAEFDSSRDSGGRGFCGTRFSPTGEGTRDEEILSCKMAKSGGWTALIVGGTGAIGKYVVAEILKNEKFASVTVLGRREISFPDEVKPTESQLKRVNYKNFSDPSEMDEWEATDLTPNQYDVAFCCLGTTRKDAGSAEAFRKVDYDGAASFGNLAKKVQVEHFQLVSSTGANRYSMFLYMKTKGEIEEFLRNLNFKQYSIFRPPLLDRGTEARTVEKVMKAVMPSVKVHDVARAMVRQAELVLQADSKGEEILGPKDIKKLYQKDTNPIPE